MGKLIEIGTLARRRKKKKVNGIILYEGPSKIDGTPIVVIATGIRVHSTNIKTGPMVQIWILLRDVRPQEAVRSGQDKAICGDCAHREDGTCYVLAFQAPTQVYDSYHAGEYEHADRYFPLLGKRARVGAYGDPAAVSVDLWTSWLMGTSGHTGYTHQWHNAPEFKGLFMASVDSPEEYARAKALGWRTFRVHTEDDSLLPGETACPALEGLTQCAWCGLCDGMASATDNRTDIATPVHGAIHKVRRFNKRASQNNPD